MKVISKAQGFMKPAPKKPKRAGAAWAISYGDMVTALLCFFIIFYAIEKQFEKQLSANPVKGYSHSEGILEEHKSSDIDTGYDYAVESLDKVEGLKTLKSSAFVDIFFKQTVFFNKGETELTPEGMKVLDEVVVRLSKLEGRYILEIQGHADSTPVKHSRNRWWKTNMELSILRALTVHSYLSSKYIDKNNLVVSGYGNQRKVASSPDGSEDINRRISLRLQLVK